MPNCNSAQCYGAELGSYRDPTVPKASYFYLYFGYVKKKGHLKLSSEAVDFVVLNVLLGFFRGYCSQAVFTFYKANPRFFSGIHLSKPVFYCVGYCVKPYTSSRIRLIVHNIYNLPLFFVQQVLTRIFM